MLISKFSKEMLLYFRSWAQCLCSRVSFSSRSEECIQGVRAPMRNILKVLGHLIFFQRRVLDYN